MFAKDFVAYVGVFLLFSAATSAASLVLTAAVLGTPTGTLSPFGPGANAIYAYVALEIAVAVLAAVIGSIVTASLTHLAVQRYRGTPETLGKAFEAGVPRFLSVLGASVALSLLTAGVLAAGFALLLLGLFAFNLAVVLLGALVLLVSLPIAIYVYIAMSLYAPAIVMEGKTAVAGLRRSWELTRGRRGTLFVVLLVLTILAGLVAAAVAIPFELLAILYFRGGATGASAIVTALGGVISSGITGSWILIYASVAYERLLAEPPPGAWFIPYYPATAPTPPGGTAAPGGPPKA